MATENEKNIQSFEKIDQISSPTIEAKHVSDAESVPIQPFGGRSSSSDSRRTSISSNSPTFSSFKPGSFEDGATSLKSKRSISVDSGIDSLSEAPDLYSSNESLSSTGNQDITEDNEAIKNTNGSTKHITAKNISTAELFGSFENKKSYSFAYESDVDDMLSSLSSNDIDHNPRALSSFTTFSDSKITYPESNKSKRRMSSDSGIDSLSEASDLYSSNESLSSTGNQDITEDSGDEKISTNKNQFASIKKSSAQNKFKKVAPPTVPTFKSNTSNVNAQTDGKLAPTVSENSDNILNLEKPMGEKVNSAKEISSDPEENLKADRSNGQFTSLEDIMPSQEKVKKMNRKDQLSSKIDEFIPQVSVSAGRTVEERVKYETLDMLKINVERLNLKMKKVDSLLKNRSLAKVDKNNNDKALLVTEKDIPLLKELKHDLNKELKKANKQLSKETKEVKIFEQSKQQDKILKGDITKIKEAISTAKSKTSLEERSSLLSKLESDLKVAYSHLGKNLHPDLKAAIKELRKERWASQTNILAIKLDKEKVKDNCLFTDKREIFSCKRDAAKSLLDSHQYKGEDKKILKGLYKLYSNLAKSSENKPKEKSNLERAFKREFGNAYEESCSTRLSEVSVSQPASSLSK